MNHEGIDKEKVEKLLMKYPIFETTSTFKFWDILPEINLIDSF